MNPRALAPACLLACAAAAHQGITCLPTRTFLPVLDTEAIAAPLH